MTEWRATYRCRMDGMRWEVPGTLEKEGFKPLDDAAVRCAACLQVGEFQMARQVIDAA